MEDACELVALGAGSTGVERSGDVDWTGGGAASAAAIGAAAAVRLKANLDFGAAELLNFSTSFSRVLICCDWISQSCMVAW